MTFPKRCLDIVGALVGIALAFPAVIVAAVLVKLDSDGPIFFAQERVGRAGRPFKILKLRTMVDGADRAGPAISQTHDPRVTRVGRVLRKWKIDELPQFINVLQGSMSLVGPRPEVDRYVRMYSREQRAVLELVPGMTDVASIAFRHEETVLAANADPESHYVQEVMPNKIRMNLEYARRASALSDVGVVVRTIAAVLLRW